jgi:hypothetical protein
MRHRVTGVALIAGVVALSCVPTATAVPTSPTPEWRNLLNIDFDRAIPGGVVADGLGNTGAGDAEVSIVTVNDHVASIGNFDGNPYLRLPRFSGARDGSFAALKVDARRTNWLSPGSGEFVFGADVRLDKLTDGSEVDDGDNVMQAGLYGDPAQFKLQVDKHRASCVIRGSKGDSVVRSEETLTPRRWYRLMCHRAGDTITLTEVPLGDHDAVRRSVDRIDVGTIDTSEASLAVGAKINREGEIVRSSTDQFNGRIDNITFSVVN